MVKLSNFSIRNLIETCVCIKSEICIDALVNKTKTMY